jgi:hypothetical protein
VFITTRPYGLSSAQSNVKARAGAVDKRGKPESRSLIRRAGHDQVAAHHLRDPLDEAEPEAGPAVAPRDICAGLREWTKQLLELGGADTDAAVSHRKYKPPAVARRWHCRGGEAYTAGAGEFHRVVGEVFQRRAQPHRVAGHYRRQILRDVDFDVDGLVAGTRREHLRDRLGQGARRWKTSPTTR